MYLAVAKRAYFSAPRTLARIKAAALALSATMTTAFGALYRAHAMPAVSFVLGYTVT